MSLTEEQKRKAREVFEARRGSPQALSEDKKERARKAFEARKNAPPKQAHQAHSQRLTVVGGAGPSRLPAQSAKESSNGIPSVQIGQSEPVGLTKKEQEAYRQFHLDRRNTTRENAQYYMRQGDDPATAWSRAVQEADARTRQVTTVGYDAPRIETRALPIENEEEISTLDTRGRFLQATQPQVSVGDPSTTRTRIRNPGTAEELETIRKKIENPTLGLLPERLRGAVDESLLESALTRKAANQLYPDLTFREQLVYIDSIMADENLSYQDTIDKLRKEGKWWAVPSDRQMVERSPVKLGLEINTYGPGATAESYPHYMLRMIGAPGNAAAGALGNIGSGLASALGWDAWAAQRRDSALGGEGGILANVAGNRGLAEEAYDLVDVFTDNSLIRGTAYGLGLAADILVMTAVPGAGIVGGAVRGWAKASSIPKIASHVGTSGKAASRAATAIKEAAKAVPDELGILAPVARRAVPAAHEAARKIAPKAVEKAEEAAGVIAARFGAAPDEVIPFIARSAATEAYDAVVARAIPRTNSPIQNEFHAVLLSARNIKRGGKLGKELERIPKAHRDRIVNAVRSMAVSLDENVFKGQKGLQAMVSKSLGEFEEMFTRILAHETAMDLVVRAAKEDQSVLWTRKYRMLTPRTMAPASSAGKILERARTSPIGKAIQKIQGRPSSAIVDADGGVSIRFDIGGTDIQKVLYRRLGTYAEIDQRFRNEIQPIRERIHMGQISSKEINKIMEMEIDAIARMDDGLDIKRANELATEEIVRSGSEEFKLLGSEEIRQAVTMPEGRRRSSIWTKNFFNKHVRGAIRKDGQNVKASSPSIEKTLSLDQQLIFNKMKNELSVMNETLSNRHKQLLRNPEIKRSYTKAEGELTNEGAFMLLIAGPYRAGRERSVEALVELVLERAVKEKDIVVSIADRFKPIANSGVDKRWKSELRAKLGEVENTVPNLDGTVSPVPLRQPEFSLGQFPKELEKLLAEDPNEAWNKLGGFIKEVLDAATELKGEGKAPSASILEKDKIPDLLSSLYFEMEAKRIFRSSLSEAQIPTTYHVPGAFINSLVGAFAESPHLAPLKRARAVQLIQDAVRETIVDRIDSIVGATLQNKADLPLVQETLMGRLRTELSVAHVEDYAYRNLSPQEQRIAGEFADNLRKGNPSIPKEASEKLANILKELVKEVEDIFDWEVLIQNAGDATSSANNWTGNVLRHIHETSAMINDVADEIIIRNDLAHINIADLERLLHDISTGNKKYWEVAYGEDVIDGIIDAFGQSFDLGQFNKMINSLHDTSDNKRLGGLLVNIWEAFTGLRYNMFLGVRAIYHTANAMTGPAILAGAVGDARLVGSLSNLKTAADIIRSTARFDILRKLGTSDVELSKRIAVIDPAGRVYTYADILRLAEDSGALRSQAGFILGRKVLSDITNEMATDNSPGAIKMLKELGSPVGRNILSDFADNTDKVFRLGAMLHALSRGENTESALSVARLSLGDYGDGWKFEKQMRKAFMFLSFTRIQVGQLSYSLLNDPNRLVRQIRLTKGIPFITSPEDTKRPENTIYEQEYMAARPIAFKSSSANKGDYAAWFPSIPLADTAALFAQLFGPVSASLSRTLSGVRADQTIIDDVGSGAVGVVQDIVGKKLSPEMKAFFDARDEFNDRYETGYIDPQDINLVKNLGLWDLFCAFFGTPIQEKAKPGQFSQGGYTYRFKSKEDQETYAQFKKLSSGAGVLIPVYEYFAPALEWILDSAEVDGTALDMDIFFRDTRLRDPAEMRAGNARTNAARERAVRQQDLRDPIERYRDNTKSFDK